MANLNSSDLRRINKRAVLRLAIERGHISKPEIASELSLSLPTVGQLTSELMEEGFLQASGTQESRGGRRAQRLQPIKNARYAVGIEFTKQHIMFIAINLAGEIVASERVRKAFEDDPDFYALVVSRRKEFTAKAQIPEEKILGVGVSVQGIISPDQKFFQSHMLGKRHLTPLHPYENDIPYYFLNDGTASCLPECYAKDNPKDFIYLMLSRTVGGSVVYDRTLQEGMNLHSGEFGHMILHPERPDMCYCGCKGHVWCYTSVDMLEDFCRDSYQTFFRRLEDGEKEYVLKFDAYLNDLAMLVTNLRAAYDMTIIIGGYLSGSLTPYLPYLKAKVAELDHLYADSRADILLSRHGAEAAALGAALHFTEEFLNGL